MKLKLLLTLTLISFIKIDKVKAQVQINGFFNEKGATNIALSYTQANFDKLYLGEVETAPIPAHDQINQTIYSIYADYAITNKLTVIATLPYITSDNESGALDPVNNTNEQSGIQDASFMIKWAPIEEIKDSGRVTYVVALGGSFASGYEPNGILSIGNGAPSIDGKLGLQYNSNSGFFGNVFVGYSVRGNAENSLGTGDFDIPNSINSQIKLGYATNIIYTDIWFDSQKSNTGVDIGGTNFTGNFPETKVNYSRVGLNVYVPINKIIGVSAGAGTVVDGRNVGKTTFYSGALVIGLGK